MRPFSREEGELGSQPVSSGLVKAEGRQDKERARCDDPGVPHGNDGDLAPIQGQPGSGIVQGDAPGLEAACPGLIEKVALALRGGEVRRVLVRLQLACLPEVGIIGEAELDPEEADSRAAGRDTGSGPRPALDLQDVRALGVGGGPWQCQVAGNGVV